MAEVERLKSIKFYDEQTKRKMDDSKRGCQVIVEQMKVREKERHEEKLIMVKEGQDLVKKIKVGQAEERAFLS